MKYCWFSWKIYGIMPDGIILVYYSVGRIFVVLIIIWISYDDVVPKLVLKSGKTSSLQWNPKGKDTQAVRATEMF